MKICSYTQYCGILLGSRKFTKSKSFCTIITKRAYRVGTLDSLADTNGTPSTNTNVNLRILTYVDKSNGMQYQYTLIYETKAYIWDTSMLIQNIIP